jgi:hypothetical protein
MCACERLLVLGLPAVLGAADRETVISAPTAVLQVVLTAREEAETARETRAALGR